MRRPAAATASYHVTLWFAHIAIHGKKAEGRRPARTSISLARQHRTGLPGRAPAPPLRILIPTSHRTRPSSTSPQLPKPSGLQTREYRLGSHTRVHILPHALTLTLTARSPLAMTVWPLPPPEARDSAAESASWAVCARWAAAATWLIGSFPGYGGHDVRGACGHDLRNSTYSSGRAPGADARVRKNSEY